MKTRRSFEPVLSRLRLEPEPFRRSMLRFHQLACDATRGDVNVRKIVCLTVAVGRSTTPRGNVKNTKLPEGGGMRGVGNEGMVG